MTDRRHPLFWLGIGIVLLIFIFLIRGILLPFVLGVFIAYFLNPAAERIEKAGVSRTLATLITLAAFFSVLSVIILLVAPVIFSQLTGLLAAFPGYVSALEREYAPRFSDWLGGLPDSQMAGVKSAAADLSGMALKLSGVFVASAFHSGMAVLTLLSLILITPVVAFHLLREWDYIIARIDQLLPREHAETIRQQLHVIDRTLAGFLRGQLNVCFIMACYYSVTLSLVGLKFGIIIGLITGLLALFPYIGFFLGMSCGLAVAFFQFGDTTPVLVTLAAFLGGSLIEGYFLTPKLVGSRVGLHPLWIIFGMLSGAALFGLVGALLAVPTTAVIGVLIRFAIERYMQSEYYRGDLPAKR